MFAHVRRRATTSLVVVASIALGVAAFLAIALASATILTAVDSRASVYGTNVTLQVIGSDAGFDERVLQRVARLPGVLEARPIIEDTLAVATAGAPAARELLRAEGVDTFAALPGDTETRDALPGPFAPAPAEPSPETLVDGRGVVVSARVATHYHVRPGSIFVAFAGARALHFRIASVFPANVGSVDSSTLYMDIATAQPAFEKRGRIDRIDCVTEVAQTGRVRAALAAILPNGLRVVAPGERFADLHRLLAAFGAGATVLSLVALLAGAALTYNAVALSVASRRADVGTLRALGARRREIFATFLCEGAAFGALGALFGLALGILGAQWAVDNATRNTDLASSVVWEPQRIVAAFAAGIACATLSSLGPAIAAARIAPTQAMSSRGFEGGARRAGH
ncbi:MAG: FtsX-like permease family protein, partial [Candidatus Eremiobacteraeota bacterium]|nr:FtsX-like permease family protein [Candidatus Eremiobacteraeota bacterium]